MESFTFELNCLPTSKESRLSVITFKELELTSKRDYPVLRDALRGTEAIWYALENRIYLVGDERRLRNQLASSNIGTGAARLVDYSEMLNKRELALRAILHSALARLMAQNDFRPSISQRQAYYPYFDAKNDIRVTIRMLGQGFTALVKDGLQFAFALSPEGRVLLWIDVKVFTFVHFEKNEMEPGEPVYVFCPNSNRVHTEREILSERVFLELGAGDVFSCETLMGGAFLEADMSDAFSVAPCASFTMEKPTPIISKVGHNKMLVPNEWVYTTVGTRELRDLSIYDRWREIAIRPAPCRYQVMKNLISLIANHTESLVIPFPEGQKLTFSLSLVKFTRKIRWPS